MIQPPAQLIKRVYKRSHTSVREAAAREVAAKEEISRREGERAKEQLELALYITSTKLNQAERAVTQISQGDAATRSPEPEDRKMER